MSDMWVRAHFDALPTRVRAKGASLSIAGIVCVTVALHVVWLARFRRGYVTEWDESGYLQFALSNFDAVHDQGPWTFAKTVAGRETFGPLLPFVTSLAYPIVGRGVFGSLLVVPLFFAGLVGAAFGVARQLVSDGWAVLAAFAVAAIPAVTDYTRLFHFAVPATACMTAAVWALLRSNGFTRTGWAVAFGVFVALMLLSRTMTVAYMPGVALAAGAQFLARQGDFRSRLRNLALATAAAVVVAGPWYIRNAPSVYDNLVGQGYGEGARRYGPDYPVGSWDYWTKELRLDLSYLWLPLACALALCFVLALGFSVARHPTSRLTLPRSARAAGLLGLSIIVVEGYLVLTSSRNEGTAFALPWLPALVVLSVTAAASVPAYAVRLALASLAAVVSISAVASKSGWLEPLADVRMVAVPGFSTVSVTDGRGLIQRVVADAGYEIEPVTEPLPRMHRLWLPTARDVVGWSLSRAEQRHQPLHLTLGLDDRIFTWSRLTLAAQLWFHQFLSVEYLRAFPAGDTVASYRRQLLAPEAANALVTGDPPRVTTITREKVEAAARSLGFSPVRRFTLPDGRGIWIWWRESKKPSPSSTPSG